MNGAGIAEDMVDGLPGGVAVGVRTGGVPGVSRGRGPVDDERGRESRAGGAGPRGSRIGEVPRVRGTGLASGDGEREAGARRGPRPVRPAHGSRRVRRPVPVPASGAGCARGLLVPPGGRTPAGIADSGARSSGRAATGVAVGARAVGPRATRVSEVGAVRVVPGAVPAARYRLRRAVAVVGLGLASTAVVVGLGLLAGAVGDAHARAAVPAGTARITVEPGESIWDVARRTVPAAGVAGSAGAVVERIGADNALPVDAAPLPVGLVLHVPA